MNIRELLEERVQTDLENLDGMDVGSTEYQTTVKGITEMADRIIEIDKIEKDYEEKEVSRKEGNELKKRELLDQMIKNGLTFVSIAGGFVITAWGTIKTFKFEETGTITSNAGRGFMNRIFSKKWLRFW